MKLVVLSSRSTGGSTIPAMQPAEMRKQSDCSPKAGRGPAAEMTPAASAGPTMRTILAATWEMDSAGTSWPGWHDHRHGGQLGRASEGVADGDQHRQERDLPGAIGKGQQGDEPGPGQIGAEEDAAAIQAVGKQPGDGREHDARQELEDEDQTQQFRGAGQAIDEQRHRHERDRFAELGTELRQPEPPEGRNGEHVAKPAATSAVRGVLLDQAHCGCTGANGVGCDDISLPNDAEEGQLPASGDCR